MATTPDPWANLRAQRDESGPNPRGETRRARPAHHALRESPGDVLDLDAVDPPPTPASVKWPTISVRISSHLAAFVREQAAIDGCSVNSWMVRRVQAARDGELLPADVRRWLTIQAAQCGHPGDPDAALVAVLRHLMDRWPHGARLQ